MAFPSQQKAEALAAAGIVIDKQNFCSGYHGWNDSPKGVTKLTVLIYTMRFNAGASVQEEKTGHARWIDSAKVADKLKL